MEPRIQRSTAGHLSRVRNARATLLRKHDDILQARFPEKYIYDKSSPSAQLKFWGFQMTESFHFGIELANRRTEQKREAVRRRQESRFSRAKRLFGNPNRLASVQLVNMHRQALKSTHITWKTKVEIKSWAMQERDMRRIENELAYEIKRARKKFLGIS